ncbi:MAG: prepilin-type N-terminal cleavage/methylation domain-containing protein [Clostridium butyricum]|nr:prepilin-type N-terminal cleavage/methylation domain-containing protein [Clostridium butyricum]
MKKKGFTLIETIISLFIVMILFAGVVSIGTVENNIYKNIENEGFIHDVYNLLTYSKLRNKREHKPGNLIVNPYENKIYYVDNKSNVIKSVALPNSMKIISGKALMPIDSSGRINKAGSIKFRNNFNELNSISIRVGIDYINCNNE